MATMLREFIDHNHDAILDLCMQRVRAYEPPEADAATRGRISAVIAQIIAALGRKDGLPTSSPLPGKSQAAAEQGRSRRQMGVKIATLSRDFGSISDSVGELGGHQGLAFEAADYQVFNLCIDASIGSAIEAYWDEDRARTDRLITERAGCVAHELRNALGSGRLAFDALKSQQLSANSRTGSVLGRSLARMEALIGQALLTVRLRSGFVLRQGPVELSALLCHLQESASPPRDVAISVAVDPVLRIEADEELLVSALGNLLQNALKFTRPGGTVSLRGWLQGDEAVVEVEDECGGLPPGKQQKLFAPFVQGEDDRRGLGLGLAIVQEAIRAHGGEVTVQDLPGRGCIFAVRLPRKPPASATS